jgi:tetratricopeptide (TPR) repeat protein
MRPLHRSRPLQIGLAVVVVAMGALGFVPLFDGPGYESSLGAGILLAFAVSVATALSVSSPIPEDGGGLAPRDALFRGLATGALFAFAAWLTTLGHGLRAGFCDALSGSECFALGPAAGALLAGAWGALAGGMARGRRRRRLVAVLLAVLGPLASILFSVGRFYTSPMIFAYDPFVGYFSGTLYDTLIDFSGLLSYRAGSAATLFAVVVLALHLGRDDGRLRLRGIGHPGLALAGALAGLGGLLANVYGDRLGHWQTSATIAATLGGRTEGVRCSVVHARSLRPTDAQRFARDCDAHVAVLERWFGAPGPARITAFVFESSAQKGALMGAAETFIAKPWRREIYVQAASYPHPVLGHELAHVIAGAFGRGPFRVSGGLGGLIPDPGVIEGVAVAAEPPEGDLLPREWAKAMKDLGLLPRLDHLFTLGFLGENAGVAYTVSGAFVGWIHQRFGADAVRAWYGGRPLPEVTGVPWADLEQRWHDDLDRQALPEAARATGKARFDRPAIFGRRCPHVVDGCRARGERLRGGGDYEGAVAAFDEVLALDPHDDGTRISIARTRVREGHEAEAAAALTGLADDPKVARHVRDRALEELGDLALANYDGGLTRGQPALPPPNPPVLPDRGSGDEAAARYAEVMSRTLDEDALRNLAIKVEAAKNARLRPAVVALLVGHGERGPDRNLAMELLSQAASAEPPSGLAHYLIARQYFNAGQYEEAADRLDHALRERIEVERARVEAERLRMVIACALGDAGGAGRFFAEYAGEPSLSESRRGAARALVERCTGSPPPPTAYDGGPGK